MPIRKALTVALASALLVAVFALPAQASPDRGSHSHRHHNDPSWSDGVRSHSVWYSWSDRRDNEESDDNSDDNGSDESDSADSTDDSTDVAPAAPAGGGAVSGGSAQTIQAENTGFSYFDNSPPSSAEICCATVHQKAGGTGTFEDPITVAVPGSGGQGMQHPAGTRLYYAKIKRYGVVEDSGASKMSKPHFDWWVAGQGFSKSSSEKCMSDITGVAPIIVNPVAGLPVTVGPLTGSSGCKL